jgi:sporulation protein YlmC with PRC-barrel domain
MDLVRDLLDKEVIDRNGRELGRVDRIVVRIRDGAPPAVVALEIGPSALARRLGATLGQWMEALEHAFAVDQGRPVRMPISQVLDLNDHVKVDVAAGETAIATIERKLRRWVRALPFSS